MFGMGCAVRGNFRLLQGIDSQNYLILYQLQIILSLRNIFQESIKNALALTPSVDMIYKKNKEFCKIVTRINPQKF